MQLIVFTQARKRRAPIGAGAPLLATAAALLATAWLVVASPAHASPPATLNSVEANSQSRIVATWEKPATDASQFVVWSTDATVGSDPDGFGAPLQSVQGSRLVSPDATSATFGRNDYDDKFNPGTYNVQVVTDGDSHPTGPGCVPAGTCDHYSNVVSVVVPEEVPPDGSGEPEPPDDTGQPPSDTGQSTNPVLAASRGHVAVQRAGSPRREPVSDGTVLEPGDKLITGAGGSARLVLSDGTKVDIGPNGEFEVVAYYTPEHGFSFNLGSLSLKYLFKTRYRVPRCNPCGGGIRGKREVTTSNAVAAVRGTDYTVETRKGFTRVRTRSGSVALRNKRGRQRRTVVVKKGYESVVRGSKPPTEPRKT